MDEREQELLARVQEQFPDARTDVEKALDFAKKAHEGEKRKTGEPYIHHPIEVALRVLELMHPVTDSHTIQAALLHDVLENTSHTEKELRNEFGDDVADIVKALTKPHTGAKHERETALDKQIMEAAQNDHRVPLIRICDQEHNLKTLDVHPPERQKELAKYKHDFVAKLADDLGLKKIGDAIRREAKKFF